MPLYPGKRYLDWPLDDPAGSPRRVRPIRDEIDRRVRHLLTELIATRPEGTTTMTTTIELRLPLDQEHLVRVRPPSLKDEFAGVFARETVERFIAERLDHSPHRQRHHLPATAHRTLHP